MDLSKLPRLSKTPEAPPSPSAEAPDAARSTPGAHCDQCGARLRDGARFCDSCGAPTAAAAATSTAGSRPDDVHAYRGSGPEAWISVALGVLLLFLAPRAIEWLFLSPASFAVKYTFSDETGAPLAYTRSVFFWGDVALASFAVVLIVEGLALAFARRAFIVLPALALTITATGFNLWYVVVMYTKGYGLQFLAGIAVAYGVYIAWHEYTLFRQLRVRRRPVVGA